MPPFSLFFSPSLEWNSWLLIIYQSCSGALHFRAILLLSDLCVGICMEIFWLLLVLIWLEYGVLCLVAKGNAFTSWTHPGTNSTPVFSIPSILCWSLAAMRYKLFIFCLVIIIISDRTKHVIIFLNVESWGFQTIELWDFGDNKTMTLHAHDDVVSSLAVSNVTGLVASTSHDKHFKIWKWLALCLVVFTM